MPKNKKFIVVIGDVISSRKVEKRKDLQDKLQDIFKLLNAPSRDSHILSPYTITLGDEFQAVYEQADSLLLDSINILEKAFPQKIRFSFGIGEISTDINREQSIGMDGSAFYYAREGILHLKNQRGNYRFNIFGLGDAEQEKLFNNTLYMYSNLIDQWNKNRYFILRSTLEGKSVKEIAQELKLSDTAIYMNIYDGSMREMIAINSIMINHINNRVMV